MTTQKDFPFKVGDKVTQEKFTAFWVQILYIGNDSFFGIDFKGKENSWYIGNHWNLYTHPKKTIRMAPALIKEKRMYLPDKISTSQQLFESLHEAKHDCGISFVQWPLTINGVEQWVDVPVGEK